MKKNVLFFSRCDFADLFGGLAPHLKDEINIIHVAYDNEEYQRLKNVYHIENIIHFKALYNQYYPNTLITDELLARLDELFLRNTNGRFNLNASIQSDRSFIHHSYEEALKITACYYNVWYSLINEYKIDFFFHEPTSLMLNHMACVICNEYGGRYVTNISVKGEADYNFLFLENDNGISSQLFNRYEQLETAEIAANQERISRYLTSFRSQDKVFFSQIYGKGNISLAQKMGLYKTHLRKSIGKVFSPHKKRDRLRDPIEFFLNEQNLEINRLRNLQNYKKIKFEQLDTKEKYFFYPLHLEPEAVVLYWADGLYKNQIKLIENIAAQLPPGYYLYVKDHPHFVGYRSTVDYAYLSTIPNVRLLSSSIPGKEIVRHSQGVITINGTAGFEALLLNKQVYTFGNAFYSVCKRVNYIHNIRDFRQEIYKNLATTYHDDTELNRFVLALIETAHEGYINYYFNTARALGFNNNENIKKVAFAYRNYILEEAK